ncbi:MAG TPA: GFA family protein [Caulobacteraceae bacterium]|jgi:hypothetical protein
MAMTGGCYCRALRYEAHEPVMFRAQCHCRECQYISGGGPNMVMGLPVAGFRYVTGAPAQFTRPDLEDANTREFCGVCGTHIATRLHGNNDMLVLKIGTLDDTSVYGGPQMAVWLDDKPPYHLVPEGVATYPKFPGAAD